MSAVTGVCLHCWMKGSSAMAAAVAGSSYVRVYQIRMD